MENNEIQECIQTQIGSVLSRTLDEIDPDYLDSLRRIAQASKTDFLIGVIERDLIAWMEEHEYESITQMRGSMSQGAVADPAAFERANYMKVLNSFNPEFV